MALLCQLAMAAWPSNVHLSNHSSVQDLEVLLLGADIHSSAIEGAELDEKVRHEHYLSALYPEPVVQLLLTMPRLLVETLVLQLWTLPFWCLFIAALVGRRDEPVATRFGRCISISVAALTVVVIALSALCYARIGASGAEAARSGLRVWIALSSICAVYLACFTALPNARRIGILKWSTGAVATLWLLWSLHSALRAAEFSAAVYLPGGLDRLLLSAAPSELAFGLLACTCTCLLSLVVGSGAPRRALRNMRSPRPTDLSLKSSLRSDAT